MLKLRFNLYRGVLVLRHFFEEELYKRGPAPGESRTSLECTDLSALWSRVGRAFRVGSKAVTSHRSKEVRGVEIV